MDPPLPSLRLDGPRLFLREFTEDDLDDIHDYERDAETMRFQSSAGRSRNESLDYLRRSITLARESPRLVVDLAIVERPLVGLGERRVTEADDRHALGSNERRTDAPDEPPAGLASSTATSSEGTLIGRAGFGIPKLEHGEAKLWYILRRDRWGCGFATEACTLLLDHAIRTLGMHRVFADIDPRNVGSVRVAEKLGMIREGLLRENFRCNGEWTDSLILGILDREWIARPR